MDLLFNQSSSTADAHFYFIFWFAFPFSVCWFFIARVCVYLCCCMLRLPCYSPCDAATQTQAHVLSGALQLDSLHFAVCNNLPWILRSCRASIMHSSIGLLVIVLIYEQSCCWSFSLYRLYICSPSSRLSLSFSLSRYPYLSVSTLLSIVGDHLSFLRICLCRRCSPLCTFRSADAAHIFGLCIFQ